jgi:hypothetical protein
MLLMLNVATLNKTLAAAALPAAYRKDHLRSLVSNRGSVADEITTKL